MLGFPAISDICLHPRGNAPVSWASFFSLMLPSQSPSSSSADILKGLDSLGFCLQPSSHATMLPDCHMCLTDDIVFIKFTRVNQKVKFKFQYFKNNNITIAKRWKQHKCPLADE